MLFALPRSMPWHKSPQLQDFLTVEADSLCYSELALGGNSGWWSAQYRPALQWSQAHLSYQLAAIKRHDAEAAKAAMRRHIEDVEEIILDRL
jgi:DNA-binding GntR family transcriptional regulator